MVSWRSNTYKAVRAANDVRAVRRNRITKRLWNRAVGHATRRLLR